MANCPKCNANNIKAIGPFAQEIIDGKQSQILLDQTVSYRCEDCDYGWQVKFDENSNQFEY